MKKTKLNKVGVNLEKNSELTAKVDYSTVVKPIRINTEKLGKWMKSKKQKEKKKTKRLHKINKEERKRKDMKKNNI